MLFTAWEISTGPYAYIHPLLSFTGKEESFRYNYLHDSEALWCLVLSHLHHLGRSREFPWDTAQRGTFLRRKLGGEDDLLLDTWRRHMLAKYIAFEEKGWEELNVSALDGIHTLERIA